MIFFTYALLLIACTLESKQYMNNSKSCVSKPDLWITVFLHGTAGAVNNASFSNIYRVMVDRVENSLYEKAVDIIRSNPYMYKNQAMQEYGLIRIDMHNRKPGQAAALFAYAYDTVLQECSTHPTEHHYYTFGWSGVLSESIRYKNASTLYKELSDEYIKKSLEYPDRTIKICLIGYSHGGTVALLLGRVQEREYTHEHFSVDLLVLIGTPIQKETDHLVTNPIFKKVYHIYSKGDKVQKMDFFSFKRFFSYRRFNDDKRFITPEKVVQIEIKIKPARRHYKSHEKRTYVNRSPGHIELWFFGWTEGTYRKEFPLHPLPAACLIPQIIKAAQEGMPHEIDLVMELYPCAERCIVKKRKYFKKVHTKSIKHETIKKLQEIAHKERPEDFNRRDYLNHMRVAIKQVYETVSYTHKNNGCHCFDFSCMDKSL